MRILAALAILAGTCPGLAAESAYTKTDVDRNCRDLASDDTGVRLLCEGYRGHDIHFAEGDLRHSVFYGHVGPWHEKGAFETFSGFNHAGETTEWRLDGGVPFATIRRWFVTPGTGSDGNALPDIQVLVVSRVAQEGDGEGCVVGFVEATANRDANVLARNVADEDARDFACRYSEPTWYGARRSAIETTSYFADRQGLE